MKNLVSNGLVFFLKILSRLPMGVLYVISDVLYIVLYKLTKYRIKVVRNNLRNSFPEKTETDLFLLEKKYYRYLSDLIMETVKGFTAGETFFKAHIHYSDTNVFDTLHQSGKSAILVMGHCGNWEWICRSAPFFLKNTIVVAYKPLTDKVFDKLMYDVRTEFGVQQVPMAGIGRYILQQKHKPFTLTLLADQSPSDASSSIWTKFLNQDTPVLSGIEKLALKYKLPVIYSDIKRYKRGHYTVTTKLLVDDSIPNTGARITELHTRQLEENIRQQPEIWLWSHKRWKLKKTSL